MGDFKKLELRLFPATTGRTPESRYWRKFKVPVVVKEFAAITNIDFAAVEPYDFAVTSSTRIQIYSSKTNAVKKTISRFKDVAYSGSFRRDGKLLVAGGEEGVVQVFDLNSRAILRKFVGHQSPVHVTKFSPSNVHVMSASDDATVRCWDLPSQTELSKFFEHGDYVRAGTICEDSPHIWATGSYDHTVKLWDIRTNASVMTIKHGAPVESLLMFPGASVMISAGSNEFKVWDILAGGKLLRTVSNHQKTITSMCFDSSKSRLITGSLDQHVKIYSVQDYRVVHSIRYTAPVLCVGLSPNDSHLVAGMSNGLLAIRHRVTKGMDTSLTQRAVQKRIHGGTLRYFRRGASSKPSTDDFTLQNRRGPRLRPYEKYLKKFQYKKALDAALLPSVRPIITVSLLDELLYRNSLRTALSDRDDVSLEPVLRFIVKHINNPKYSAMLVTMSDVILDMYGSFVGQSMLLDEQLAKIKHKITQELQFQKQMLQLVGCLDMILSANIH